MYGYWGKILRVNLTKKSISAEYREESFWKKYLGGEGVSAKILYDEVPENADPLGPENKIIFAVGPTQGGSNILGNGRFSISAKSPLTNIFGSSMAGGYIAEELKKTGFDVVVIEGKSSKPVYLFIKEEKAEIINADKLWNKKDTFETEDAIKEEIGDSKVKVAAIGLAGENLVRYACVICNYGHGIAGRTGMGAVMGSKNLKAIAFRGDKKVKIADQNKLKALKKELRKIISEADFTKANRQQGQAMAVAPREEIGLLPIKNFMEDKWVNGAAKISAGEGYPFNDILKPRPSACSNCIMGCHRRVKIEDKKYGMDGYGPEYETLAMLGSNCLIDDLIALNKLNDMCNRYGIDTIDFGATCAMVMEAYEKGKINKSDLGNIELTWGNADGVINLLDKIVKREGKTIKILGEGLKISGEKLGCPEAALHVNGAAVVAHDPRAFLSMAVSQSISMKGGSHTHGFSEAIELGVTFPEAGKELSKKLDPHSDEKKGLAAAKYQDLMAVYNSIVICFFYQFSNVTFTHLKDLLNAITGWEISNEELLKTGERIICVENMFNIKHGLEPMKDYWLPKRFFTPHKDGGAAGVEMPLRKMIDEYFAVKDWPNGIPSNKKLKELSLDYESQ